MNEFPVGFVWGAGAASYQVEGGAYEGGRGTTVWDVMCWTPGKIWDGHTGEVGCDHYHRWREDVQIMKQIGLQAYRFSIAWTRILPSGQGKTNAEGIGFYDRLVDALLEAGIEPWVTLFHWDYPYELFCKGGWLSPDSPKWFGDYAAVVADALSDRVTKWMTLNEPPCFIGLGLQSGDHAPGLKLGFSEVLRAAHNTLLGHGLAVQALRERCKKKPMIGMAMCGRVTAPVSEDRADVEAARSNMFDEFGWDVWNYALWTDPIFFGRYHENAIRLYGNAMPRVTDNDMKIIAQPLDFYGMNIYSCGFVKAGKSGRPEHVALPVGYGMTTMEWPVTPEALYWGPRFAWERYRKPIVITENGMSNTDWIALDGGVHDPQRIDFLTRYLKEYRRAIEGGVQAIGYFQWSIMDNFEWAHGYKRRFGLVYVDYPSGRRILKDSARWYRDVIRSNGAGIG